MPKVDLSPLYVDEAQHIQTLKFLGNNIVSTGQKIWTSASSGISYNTADHSTDPTIFNQGDKGIMNLLIKTYGGANGFLVEASDLNTLTNNITNLNTSVSNLNLTKQNLIEVNGILKGDGAGHIEVASPTSDYQNTININGILKGSGSGSVEVAISGNDYIAPDSGTWIPILKGTSTVGNWTPNANNFGRYVKNGKQVICEMRISGILTGLPASELIVFSGLPFAPNDGLAGLNGIASWNNIISQKVITFANIGTSKLEPRLMFNGSSDDYLLFSQLQTGGNIISANFSYITN